MVGPDSDFRYHPQEEEVKPRPRLIPIQDMVLEGTVGFSLVAGIENLGQRLRPETTFNQSLESLWNHNARALRELKDRDVATVGDALRLTDEQLSSFKYAGEAESRLQEYLAGLSLTPHARLIEAIFIVEGNPQNPQYPVPADREHELVSAVEEAAGVESLGERGAEVIAARFGLTDGIKRSTRETAELLGTTGSRINQIEQKRLRMLRHTSRSRNLRNYFSLPEESFGRRVFGAVFHQDLPRFEIDVREDLGLSDAALRELGERQTDDKNHYIFEADSFLRVDFKDKPLSSEVSEEIGNAFRRFTQEHQ